MDSLDLQYQRSRFVRFGSHINFKLGGTVHTYCASVYHAAS